MNRKDSEIMYPSEKRRNMALRWSSYKFAQRMWIIMLIAFLLLTTCIAIFVPRLPEERFIFIAASFAFCLFLGLMAFGILALTKILLTKGIEEYEPVSGLQISIDALCEEALLLNEETDWQVEAHKDEGWIDVTWKWKDSVDLFGAGVRKNQEIFYKLIKLYDDYTYEDLDMIISTNAMLGLGGTGFSKSFAMGHIQNKRFEMTLGRDADGTGLHEYSLNTVELTNFMHKWLAEHGYAYRGL